MGPNLDLPRQACESVPESLEKPFAGARTLGSGPAFTSALGLGVDIESCDW